MFDYEPTEASEQGCERCYDPFEHFGSVEVAWQQTLQIFNFRKNVKYLLDQLASDGKTKRTEKVKRSNCLNEDFHQRSAPKTPADSTTVPLIHNHKEKDMCLSSESGDEALDSDTYKYNRLCIVCWYELLDSADSDLISIPSDDTDYDDVDNQQSTCEDEEDTASESSFEDSPLLFSF